MYGKDIAGSNSDVDTFVRRTSLVSAVIEANQVTGECGRQTHTPYPNKNAQVKYAEGVPIGTSLFQQLTPCALLGAVLSAKQLERISTSHGDQFLWDSKPVTAFPDVITLEISPAQVCSTGWHNVAVVQDASLEDLSFRIKWLGAAKRDLGTISAKLLLEPWPELGTPEKFFRLEIPAKGVPFDESLEVRISDREGQQVGCILGHI